MSLNGTGRLEAGIHIGLSEFYGCIYVHTYSKIGIYPAFWAQTLDCLQNPRTFP